jgi:hypothetical protein
MTKPRDDRPLASARRYLRQREREQKAAAKRADEAPAAPVPLPPLPSGVEVVAAIRRSRDARTKVLEQIRQQVERITENSTISDLHHLAGTLSLYERRIARRNDRT